MSRIPVPRILRRCVPESAGTEQAYPLTAALPCTVDFVVGPCVPSNGFATLVTLGPREAYNARIRTPVLTLTRNHCSKVVVLVAMACSGPGPVASTQPATRSRVDSTNVGPALSPEQQAQLDDILTSRSSWLEWRLLTRPLPSVYASPATIEVRAERTLCVDTHVPYDLSLEVVLLLRSPQADRVSVQLERGTVHIGARKLVLVAQNPTLSSSGEAPGRVSSRHILAADKLTVVAIYHGECKEDEAVPGRAELVISVNGRKVRLAFDVLVDVLQIE